MTKEHIRPWGRYEVREKTKLIYVNPNQRLSLQYHELRDEYWTIVKGEGQVQIGDKILPAKEGDDFYIPRREKHRIIAGKNGISFLEVAVGIVDEDDIFRIEDDYDRAEGNNEN